MTGFREAMGRVANDERKNVLKRWSQDLHPDDSSELTTLISFSETKSARSSVSSEGNLSIMSKLWKVYC